MQSFITPCPLWHIPACVVQGGDLGTSISLYVAQSKTSTMSLGGKSILQSQGLQVYKVSIFLVNCTGIWYKLEALAHTGVS